MFKNDTMVQYVTDRHPHLAPRAPRPAMERIDWTVASVAQEARQAAVASLTRQAAPVVDLWTRRAVTVTVPSIA